MIKTNITSNISPSVQKASLSQEIIVLTKNKDVLQNTQPKNFNGQAEKQDKTNSAFLVSKVEIQKERKFSNEIEQNNIGSKKPLDNIEKRRIANCNERRRMKNINAGFESLRDCLNLSIDNKYSKAALLQMAANEMKSLTEKYKEATEKLKTYEDARLRCSCGAIINAEKVTLTRVPVKHLSNEDEGIGSPYSCEEVEDLSDANQNMYTLTSRTGIKSVMKLPGVQSIGRKRPYSSDSTCGLKTKKIHVQQPQLIRIASINNLNKSGTTFKAENVKSIRFISKNPLPRNKTTNLMGSSLYPGAKVVSNMDVRGRLTGVMVSPMPSSNFKHHDQNNSVDSLCEKISFAPQTHIQPVSEESLGCGIQHDKFDSLLKAIEAVENQEKFKVS